MRQCPGFEVFDKSLICKLNKAIYGLKQAPRAWYEHLTTTLLHFVFVHNKYDLSLLDCKKSIACVYLLVYVDDIIITSTYLSLMQQFISKLNATFSLKQLGDLDYFLGIEVKHVTFGSMLLSQAKYIGDFLYHTNMHERPKVFLPLLKPKLNCLYMAFITLMIQSPIGQSLVLFNMSHYSFKDWVCYE
uniref:Copia protein n=1 Tax=Cajanus cajan TaxID=3821 RepID=A0A151U400_CAJCA|nr:Copia protein [Cajanus cajan]